MNFSSMDASALVNGKMELPPRYVESKFVDHDMVRDLLAISAKANQWSNFGPLSRMLEERLAQVLAIPDHLCVVACSNATVATHMIAAMHQCLSGKPLRWVTSAFGFYSSCDGILSDAEIVDCDQDGMLDLDALDPAAFDGLIVTNVFGRYRSLESYQQYAREHGKVLLIDSAMAFHAGGHVENECISLHHTKPWGFGEGGCAIIDRRHESLFRDLLSFGHASAAAPINRLATNGKISDVSCAYLLMRLSHVAVFRESYQEQFQRIVKIGEDLGLTLLGGEATHPGVPASVPFLLPVPTALADDFPIPVRRYYYPLADRSNARSIYQRIVNVACHAEMARFPDRVIRGVLLQLLDTAKLTTLCSE